VLRTILFALLFSLLFGMAVGTAIRRRMEAPTRYIGLLAPRSTPLDVATAVAGVFESGQHEEQVG
jgi:uncharacterized membrane protein YeiB